MTPERRERIGQIADELEAQGLPATHSAVYARALGHRGDVTTVMQERRAGHPGGVAVLEEEPDAAEAPLTADELQEDLAQLAASYEAWHVALERLWEIEQEGPLSEAHFGRKQWLEYQLVKTLQTQEQLRPALAAARSREQVRRAVEAHDAGIPASQRQVEAAVQLLAQAAAAWRTLITCFEAQADALFAPRDARGEQALPVEPGTTEALRFFLRLFPHDARARDAFDLLVQSPPPHGALQEALSNCPRLKPYPPYAIDRYLRTLEGG